MIVVEGKIKGKARPRMTKTGHTYTPNDTVNYENWVKVCYQQQDGKLLEGSVRAIIIAYFEIPKSYSKTKRELCVLNISKPTKKPDVDNIAKIILDSLNKIAYEDDSQIGELTIMKKWTKTRERVEFVLEEIR